MDTMTRTERERLLDAMLEEMAEKAYGEIEVERAMRRAGIADRDCAAEFGDKDACLFAAYERLTERLIGRATEGCDAGRLWPERIRHGLEALLDELAAQPELARVATRSFPAIRPNAYTRYIGLLEAFTPFLKEGRNFSGVAEELPEEVEMLAVGAAESIIFEEIEAGRTTKLPSLMPAILFSLLVPFMGPDEASAAMQSASAAM